MPGLEGRNVGNSSLWPSCIFPVFMTQSTVSFACSDWSLHFVCLVCHIRRSTHLSMALMSCLCMFGLPSIWPDTPWLTRLWADSLPCIWNNISMWLLDGLLIQRKMKQGLFSDVCVYSLRFTNVRIILSGAFSRAETLGPNVEAIK